MAGTTIKGVGNSGNVQIPDMVTAAKQNAGTSFQAVWNKTQSNAQTTNAADGDRTQAGRNDVRRGESLRAGGRQRDNVADVSDGNKTMEGSGESSGSCGNGGTEPDPTDHGYIFRQ